MTLFIVSRHLRSALGESHSFFTQAETELGRPGAFLKPTSGNGELRLCPGVMALKLVSVLTCATLALIDGQKTAHSWRR